MIQGHREEGLDKMRYGMALWNMMGAELSQPMLYSMLAEAYAEAEQPENGLQAIDEALRIVISTGEDHFQAELYQLKGELLLRVAHGEGHTALSDDLEKRLDRFLLFLRRLVEHIFSTTTGVRNSY